MCEICNADTEIYDGGGLRLCEVCFGLYQAAHIKFFKKRDDDLREFVAELPKLLKQQRIQNRGFVPSGELGLGRGSMEGA